MELPEITSPSKSPSLSNNRHWFSRSNSIPLSAINGMCITLKNITTEESISYLGDDTKKRCSICLEVMLEEEGNIFTVTACSHAYHIKCITEWKKLSNECPCCRGLLPEEIGPTNPRSPHLMNEDMLAPAASFQPIMDTFPVLQITNEMIENNRQENHYRNREVRLVQHMTDDDMITNAVLFPLGIVYPMLLFCLLVGYLLVVAFPFCVIFCFLKIPYDTYDSEAPLMTTVIVILIYIKYPLYVLLAGVALIGFICYIFCKTLEFYVKAFTCKVRWKSARNFIVTRPLTRAFQNLASLAT